MPANTPDNYEFVWQLGTLAFVIGAILLATWFATRQRDETLWAVYIAGPDELEAMPSKRAARRRAADLNAFFDEQEHGPAVNATVIPWPYSRTDHAEDIDARERNRIADLALGRDFD